MSVSVLNPKCNTSTWTVVAPPIPPPPPPTQPPKKEEEGLSVLNAHYDAKNSRACDNMIRNTTKLHTVLLFYDLVDRS